MHSEAIMNEFFQSHESHIPYLHQFFIDFNLYGMDFLKTNEFLIRASDHDTYLNEAQASPLAKTTKSFLEIDVSAFSILNRHEIIQRKDTPIYQSQNVESNTKLVPSLQNIWLVKLFFLH